MSEENIEKLFLEMKDTSELMLDLAYSALIYEHKEIVEEVFTLEGYIDKINAKLQRTVLINAIENKNPDKALIMIRLATCIETIADSALEIAKVVHRGIKPHPIFKESIMASDVIISKTNVENEKISGRTIGELKVASTTGMWVIAIRRDNSWIFGPDENTMLKKDDILIIRGPVESIKEIEEMMK